MGAAAPPAPAAAPTPAPAPAAPTVPLPASSPTLSSAASFNRGETMDDGAETPSNPHKTSSTTRPNPEFSTQKSTHPTLTLSLVLFRRRRRPVAVPRVSSRAVPVTVKATIPPLTELPHLPQPAAHDTPHTKQGTVSAPDTACEHPTYFWMQQITGVRMTWK